MFKFSYVFWYQFCAHPYAQEFHCVFIIIIITTITWCQLHRAQDITVASFFIRVCIQCNTTSQLYLWHFFMLSILEVVLLFCITCIIDARLFVQTDCKHLSCYIVHKSVKLWTLVQSMCNSLQFLLYSSFLHPSAMFLSMFVWVYSGMEMLLANCMKSPVYIIHDALALWRRTSGKRKIPTCTTLKV